MNSAVRDKKKYISMLGMHDTRYQIMHWISLWMNSQFNMNKQKHTILTDNFLGTLNRTKSTYFFYV